MKTNLLLPASLLPQRNRFPRIISLRGVVASLSLLIMATTFANVITFEDAVPADSFFIAQGYQGFQWTGGLYGDHSWVLATPTDTEDLFNAHAHSGANYIWSNGGTSLRLSDGHFNFNSVWVASGGSETTSDTAHGFLNGIEIFTQTFAVGTTYSEIALNFTGIDTITFDTTNNNLLMDDINITTASVPDGGPTIAMVGLGIGAIAGVRRRLTIATQSQK